MSGGGREVRLGRVHTPLVGRRVGLFVSQGIPTTQGPRRSIRTLGAASGGGLGLDVVGAPAHSNAKSH